MPFLVDSNVLSEITKPTPNGNVVQWLLDNETELVIDPIVLGELETGILILPTGKRRQNLEAWFAKILESIHCLTWSAETARCWARLLADLRAKGQAMPLKDSLIAASALSGGLTIATANWRDFQHAGVPILNPFE